MNIILTKPGETDRRYKKPLPTEERDDLQRQGYGRSCCAPDSEGKVQCLTGQQRGRLIPLPERQKIISLVLEAATYDARKISVCQYTGISIRTPQLWIDVEVISVQTEGLVWQTGKPEKVIGSKKTANSDTIQFP